MTTSLIWTGNAYMIQI